VVRIRLVSDETEEPKEAGATKVHVQAVLDVLAGRRVVYEKLKKEIPGELRILLLRNGFDTGSATA